VEEIWYFIEGQGEVWRKIGNHEEIVRIQPAICLTIPVGTHFQFRNLGTGPLRFIIATMPPWLGAKEAVKVKGIWPVT
jgi:mannose-6-phosphate isomerase-like protein (cupin superfamily)